MIWLKLYQSAICWLVSGDCAEPCHRLILPQGQALRETLAHPDG